MSFRHGFCSPGVEPRFCVQGTFQKIHLQSLFRQQLFGLLQLVLQRHLFSVRRLPLLHRPSLRPLVWFLRLPPLVEPHPRDAQFLGQGGDIRADFHPPHRHRTELFRIPSFLFFQHGLIPFRCKSVTLHSVSL
jgi:hypothetical protein